MQREQHFCDLQLQAANDEIAQLQDEIAGYKEQLSLLTSQLKLEQEQRAEQAQKYKMVSVASFLAAGFIEIVDTQCACLKLG